VISRHTRCHWRTDGEALFFVLAVGCALMLWALPAHAQAEAAGEPPSAAAPMEPRERIDRFFAALGRDRVEDAYQGLVAGSILMEKPEDLENLKTRTQRALDAYGVLRGYELLEERTVGTALKRFTCLSLNEDLPLRWRFYFYLNPRGWKLVDLRVDDGLVELFEELGRP
jgi:hypothetical protein